MTSRKQVSVVMSVFNGAETLGQTLQSILTQQGCDFEVIAINDGSSDGSGRILDEWAARDEHLRVIHQSNTGLTRALIRGCEEARGEFIARQDCGDLSLPGRLATQVAHLRQHHDTVMVACGARFTGPGGEVLHEVSCDGLALQEGLRNLDVNRVKGPPHHGGTMFRRSAYHQAGGYRLPFVVAQDLDLWLRMSEVGTCIGLPALLYSASVEAGSITSRRREEQFRLAALAVSCAADRRSGVGERDRLDAFVAPPPSLASRRPTGGVEKARYFYFLGASLRQRDRNAARRYFRQALRENPLHFKALWRYVWG